MVRWQESGGARGAYLPGGKMEKTKWREPGQPGWAWKIYGDFYEDLEEPGSRAQESVFNVLVAVLGILWLRFAQSMKIKKNANFGEI